MVENGRGHGRAHGVLVILPCDDMGSFSLWKLTNSTFMICALFCTYDSIKSFLNAECTYNHVNKYISRRRKASKCSGCPISPFLFDSKFNILLKEHIFLIRKTYTIFKQPQFRDFHQTFASNIYHILQPALFQLASCALLPYSGVLSLLLTH